VIKASPRVTEFCQKTAEEEKNCARGKVEDAKIALLQDHIKRKHLFGKGEWGAAGTRGESLIWSFEGRVSRDGYARVPTSRTVPGRGGWGGNTRRNKKRSRINAKRTNAESRWTQIRRGGKGGTVPKDK